MQTPRTRPSPWVSFSLNQHVECVCAHAFAGAFRLGGWRMNPFLVSLHSPGNVSGLAITSGTELLARQIAVGIRGGRLARRKPGERVVSQVPSCLSNAVLEGPGLWSQPSPCFPAKGCSPPVPSPVHHPIASHGRGLSQPCPPMPGPAWRAPQHLGHATHRQSHPLRHSVSHLFTGQLLCSRHCAAVASSGSHGLWIT